MNGQDQPGQKAGNPDSSIARGGPPRTDDPSSQHQRLEPIHPDDIDADDDPESHQQARKRNPLADSPDDGE
jgi:hypothetical protein